MSRLQSAGLGPQQVIELRARFGPAMRMHNFAIPRCERVHLGLFDLLAATHPDCTYPDNDWTRKCRAAFSSPSGPFCDAEHYSALYWQSHADRPGVVTR
jgi:hypothetical protein